MLKKMGMLSLLLLLLISSEYGMAARFELQTGTYYNVQHSSFGSISLYRDGTGVSNFGNKDSSESPMRWMFSKEGYLITSPTNGVINSTCFIVDDPYLIPVMNHSYYGPKVKGDTFNAEFRYIDDDDIAFCFYTDGSVILKRADGTRIYGTYTCSDRLITVNYENDSRLIKFLLHDGCLYSQFLTREP